MSVDEKDNGPVRVVDRRWWARNEGQTDQAAAEESAARKPTVVEDLERQLGDTRNRLQDVLTEHRRSLDEFEQVKLRIRRDVARDVERGRRTILVDLLDVVDNLERAIEAARREATASGSASAVEPLARGVELVRDSFLSKLQAFGVTRMPALGQKFDAARHEAVTTTPVSDPAEDGVVVAVVKDGYAIGDDILRPASVVVGQLAS
jgi:molecular chaperone GrpE